MPDGVRLELVLELTRLLKTAGTDERAATAGFHELVATHGRDDVRAALVVVAAEYFATEAACARGDMAT
ncbi:hypothetical protein [Gandjariella thermophila]|uniref:LuxR family transcriptional regulator n=1 Tax=Gandjariella thermophila TaxID=1931992 RepID=A0A4D4JGW4_9PSEU|nr:hypothetical protein [Gandjariella thermophila]GDY33137.1 hypothetical protein GTS_47700 [Gandjariella thermophila]